MSKRFEVGKYAIDNKSKGTAGPQSTIYQLIGARTGRKLANNWQSSQETQAKFVYG